MLERLLRAIRSALMPRWDARLPDIVQQAERIEPGVSPSEAYQEGYRRAYWDAVVDMAEADLLKDPRPRSIRIPVVPLSYTRPSLSDEVH